MANKLTPKISSPGSINPRPFMDGGRNTEKGKHGAGLAPKPKGGAPIAGNDRPSMPTQAGLARVSGAGASSSGPSGPAGSFLPVQKPQPGLQNRKLGQPNPDTAAAATRKPKRRGIGAAFYGEY